MTWLGTIANNVFRNIIFTDTPPNVVLALKPEQYSNRRIHCREDGVILYCPGTDKTEKYDIVLHRPCTEAHDQAYRYNGNENLPIHEKKHLILGFFFPVCFAPRT